VRSWNYLRNAKALADVLENYPVIQMVIGFTLESFISPRCCDLIARPRNARINSNLDDTAPTSDRTTFLSSELLHIHVRANPTSSPVASAINIHLLERLTSEDIFFFLARLAR